jgi:hypothetical protein
MGCVVALSWYVLDSLGFAFSLFEGGASSALVSCNSLGHLYLKILTSAINMSSFLIDGYLQE